MRLIAICLLVVACGKPPTLTTDPPKWPSLPITVSLEPDAADFRASLEQAAKLWDGAMGRPMFTVTTGSADVTVGIGSVTPGRKGSCTITRSPLRARIELMGVADTGAAYYILAHELGHVLGLAHDPGERSIMVPALDAGELMAESPMPMYLVQSEDVEAIRALYRNAIIGVP